MRELLADVSGLRRSVGFRIPEGELTCVVGIGARLWDRLFGSPAPGGPASVSRDRGARHTASATPGDLLFHIRAHRLDLCFELAQRLTDRLGGVRDAWSTRSTASGPSTSATCSGSSTAPRTPRARPRRTAVLIGDEDPAFAGGSYVIVQKYLHDLDAWDALAVEEQERAIGRTKLSDLELPDEVKPANSHVALNTIVDDDGDERQIMRFNMPFGRVGAGEFGTYFIGYARSPDVIEQMLTNMFVGKPAGQLRPDPRLLDRPHREPVLRPHRRLPRRPACARRRHHPPPNLPSSSRQVARQCPMRVTRHRQPAKSILMNQPLQRSHRSATRPGGSSMRKPPSPSAPRPASRESTRFLRGRVDREVMVATPTRHTSGRGDLVGIVGPTERGRLAMPRARV